MDLPIIDRLIASLNPPNLIIIFHISLGHTFDRQVIMTLFLLMMLLLLLMLMSKVLTVLAFQLIASVVPCCPDVGC